MRNYTALLALSLTLVLAPEDLWAARFVIPHFLESPGLVTNTKNTSDTQLIMTYAGGQAALKGSSGATVNLYLYDKQDGRLLQSKTGRTVCNPCTFRLGSMTPRLTITFDELITKAGGFDLPIRGNAVVVTAGNDDANVNMVGFVVNAITGPHVVTVFAHVPQEIAAPAP